MEEFRDYGMREYKAPLSLRIKNFFFTHPIMVAVLVAIIISLFMGGCDKARAEEMDARDVTYIEGILDGVDNYAALETDMAFVYHNFPYFVHFHQEYFDVILFTSDPTVASRHYNVTTTNNLPDLNFYYLWGFRGNTDRMYITGYDTSFTMSSAVTNPHTTSSRNEKIFEVQLVVQNYHDLIAPIKTASLGCFCLYDDDLLSQNFSSNLYDLETGESQGSYSFKYNYFSDGSCRQNWVDSSTGNTYQYPFQLRGWNGSEYRFNGSYDYLDLVNEEIYTNHRTWIADGNSTSSSTVYGWIEPNIEYPPSYNTPGFECYKLETKGGIYFIADFSNLISISPAVGNSSTFTCDIHLDDTIQTVTLDSTSEDYYIYDASYRQAEYAFPITAFAPNYNDYENVWIDNVNVVNTTSSPGGSYVNTFIYIDPIVIQGSVPTDDLEPSTIPQISPMPESLEEYGIEYHSGDELKELYNNNMFNQWITESEFYSDIAQLGGGRSVKLVGATDQNVPANNTDNTLAYLENVAAILEGTADVPGVGAVMTVVYGVNAFFDTVSAPRNNGQIDFNGAAEAYIKDNLYSSTYDIIVLQAYYDAEALQTNSNDLLYTPIPSIDDLHAGEPYAGYIYYVILTQRYIESLNLDGLGSLQRLMESDVHYVKGIYDYMYDRLNDFEDKSLDSFKGIIGVENNILDKLNNVDTFIQRIEGVLNKILDALKNLHLSQLDAIDADLDTVIAKLDNIASHDPNEYDTVEEAIAYYKANNDDGLPDSNVFTENRFSLWFSGKVHDWWASMNHNGGDAQHPTASLLGATFDALKSTYESMTSETKILDNIIYFVNSFSDDDPDDTDTTYMTGLFKDNFDIDAYNGAEVSNE